MQRHGQLHAPGAANLIVSLKAAKALIEQQM